DAVARPSQSTRIAGSNRFAAGLRSGRCNACWTRRRPIRRLPPQWSAPLEKAMRNVNLPVACVMGDMDLVRPLGLAGIPCVAVAPRGAPTRFTRFARHALDWVDAWDAPEAQVDVLVRFAEAQPEPPVLYYEEDRELLLVSRFRDRLARAFRFVAADADLVEALVDKARFQELAARLDLPVPRAHVLHAGVAACTAALAVRLPCIVKPLTRRVDRWEPV